MFSLDRFYNIIHNNLVSYFPDSESNYFYPFGTYENCVWLNELVDSTGTTKINVGKLLCCFLDQEPWYDYTLEFAEKATNIEITPNIIFANSEHSVFKDQYLESVNKYDWYYFFHGFVALDWYKDFEYIHPKSFNQFDKVFICYNHIISKYRSYRLHLASNLIAEDLTKYGHVSLPLSDINGSWRDAIYDPLCILSPRAKVQVVKTLNNVDTALQIDNDTPVGTMSASVNFDQLTSALWHVVTETVYFLPKLHLTEKIFKPIVAKRPFILVAAPGNLAYLKSYGFKTFDRWIDESYDQEQDHYIRIEKITAEIKKLCSMSAAELKEMHREMQDVLEFNHYHFYNNFKQLIVNELVDNFSAAIDKINSTRDAKQGHYILQFPNGYLDEVKTRLSK